MLWPPRPHGGGAEASRKWVLKQKGTVVLMCPREPCPVFKGQGTKLSFLYLATWAETSLPGHQDGEEGIGVEMQGVASSAASGVSSSEPPGARKRTARRTPAALSRSPGLPGSPLAVRARPAGQPCLGSFQGLLS